MPFVRVEPDLFLEHKGVEVFPLYDESGRADDYWFTTNPDNADEFYGHRERGQFDARLLACRWEGTPTVAQWDDFWKPRHVSEEAAIEALIEAAIDDGIIPFR